MSQRVVYLNDRLVREADARLSIYDSALQMGDMAYEVIRTCRQQPLKLREHVDRLFRTLDALKFDPGISRERCVEIAQETLARNLPSEDSDVDWNITLSASRGPLATFHDAFLPDERRPTFLVSCFPLLAKMAALAPLYRIGIDLVVPRQKSFPAELLDPAIKTRSRVHFQLANQQAAAMNPAAFAVLLDPDGHLTEGTNGNIFAVLEGTLHTPQTRNILPGVTRALVLELAARLEIPTAETNLNSAAARGAEEMFLTSTSIGILHARTFAGRALGDGHLGPITAQLRTALFEEIGLDLAQQAADYAARTTGEPFNA